MGDTTIEGAAIGAGTVALAGAGIPPPFSTAIAGATVTVAGNLLKDFSVKSYGERTNFQIFLDDFPLFLVKWTSENFPSFAVNKAYFDAIMRDVAIPSYHANGWNATTVKCTGLIADHAKKMADYLASLNQQILNSPAALGAIGKFDWAGRNNYGGSDSPFLHLVDGFNVSRNMYIKVTGSRYNGVFQVTNTSADNGTYLNSGASIATPFLGDDKGTVQVVDINALQNDNSVIPLLGLALGIFSFLK